MKLQITGGEGLPALLLIPARDLSADELVRRLRPLEKSYRLLAAEGDGTAEELAAALRNAGAEELWGAYGLREGGTRLLELLSGGAVRARIAVVEGPFALPARSLKAYAGRLVCWMGGKDKKAKKAWKKLKEDVPSLRSLTLGKLKAGQDYSSVRPDRMVKRLEATLGTARTVRLTHTLTGAPEQVWRQICRRPAGSAEAKLAQRPLVQDDDRLTLRLEGGRGRLALWSHTLRLEPLGDDRTVCVDQVDLEAGKLTGAAAALAKWVLRGEQKRRKDLLRREK